MAKIIRLVIQALVIGYLVIFAMSNSGNIQFKFFLNTATYETPLFLMILACLFIGLIIGAGYVYFDKLVTDGFNRKLKKEIKKLESEIERLNKLTITNSEPEKKALEEVKSTENSNIKEVLR